MCEFPYILNNNTCITIASSLSPEYQIYQSIFLSLSIIGLLLNGFLLYYYFDKKAKRYQYLGLTGSNFFLMLQFIDPLGYNDVLPYFWEVLFSDLSTWISLCVFIYLIIELINVNNLYQVNHYTKYQISYIIISFIINIILTFLQGLDNKYLWRGIKLILLAIFETSLTILLNYYIKESLFLAQNNIVLMSRLYFKTSLFNFLISSIISFQLFIGFNSFYLNNEINYHIGFNQLILPTFQIIGNYFGSWFFFKKRV